MEIPAVVKLTLQKNYQNAEELKWEKENSNYEASFEFDKTEYSLLIDSVGNILETEIEIKTNELPVEVKNYVAKNYADQKIKEAAKIIDNKGTVTYEAEVNDKDLIFDSNGNIIK
ncbi:MAG: PepSY-like domain-containing protein [Sphingobacteriales bacterium]|nr:MAG: PepSY-like domain-containing protein [Sphingobacteriales bacterium]